MEKESLCVFDSNSFYFLEERTEYDSVIGLKQRVKKELAFCGALL